MEELIGEEVPMIQPRKETELMAVRFQKEHDERGFHVLLIDVSIQMHVIEVNGMGVYIFSSTYWNEVEGVLRNADIPYEYHRASSFSKTNLESAVWTRRGEDKERK